MTVVISRPALALLGIKFKRRTSTLGGTVHCSATRPSQDWGAVEIDRMHRERGFACVGYQYIIRRNGVIEAGRPHDAVGAHCSDGGRNHTHLGICLIGGVSEDPVKHVPGSRWNGSDAECNFTVPQMVSLKALLKYLGIARPEGHRDVPGVKKACPAFDVAHWLKTGEARLDAPKAPVKPAPAAK